MVATSRATALLVTLVFALSIPLAVGAREALAARVILSEWEVRVEKKQLPTGRLEFEVLNSGTYGHAFAIEWESGGKKYYAATPVIEAGKKATLVVNLPEGRYQLFCYVEEHRGFGMEAELQIAGAAPKKSPEPPSGYYGY